MKRAEREWCPDCGERRERPGLIKELTDATDFYYEPCQNEFHKGYRLYETAAPNPEESKP